MSWVRIDDAFPEHPRVANVGALGMAMQVAGLCYCNRRLTDGFIPRGVALRLLDFEMQVGPDRYVIGLTSGHSGQDATADLVIEALVEAEIWVAEEGGYRIPNYDEYQPTKGEIRASRARREEARKRGYQAVERGDDGRFKAAGHTAQAPLAGPLDGPQTHRSQPQPHIDTRSSSVGSRSVGSRAGARRIDTPDSIQHALLLKLHDANPTYQRLTHAIIVKLNRRFTRPVVCAALQRLRETPVPPEAKNPIAYLTTVCASVAEESA